MTPRPNIFGWLVLGGFVGAAVYALTGKAKAAIGCKITVEGVQKFHDNQTLATNVLWVKTSGPPDAEPLQNKRIKILGLDASVFPIFDSPLIVIDKDEEFYKYSYTGLGEITIQGYPKAKEEYCRINAGG